MQHCMHMRLLLVKLQALSNEGERVWPAFQVHTSGRAVRYTSDRTKKHEEPRTAAPRRTMRRYVGCSVAVRSSLYMLVPPAFGVAHVPSAWLCAVPPLSVLESKSLHEQIHEV
jgi:hypothetical protein